MQFTSETLKTAFYHFVELVKPIDEVQCVVGVDAGTEIYTYIKQMDRSVSKRIFEKENQIILDFPELPTDFHIVFLEGRPLEDFVRKLPELAYVRNKHG
jgi:hypothetical protein